MISYLENTLRYAGDEDLGKAVLYETMFAGTPYGHIPAGRVEEPEEHYARRRAGILRYALHA